jgi:hypothetical protein
MIWRGKLAMDAKSWKPPEHPARQWASLEAATQRPFRMGERPNRLIKGIALILFVAGAVGLLACATLALVGIDCPNAHPHILGRRASVNNGSTQSGDACAAFARAYVTACATMRKSRGTALS